MKLPVHALITVAVLSYPVVLFGQQADLSHAPDPTPVVKLGNEMLFEKHVDLIRGKKIGLITNPTGINSRFQPTIKRLYESRDCKLVALFGPEHGVWGQFFAGTYIPSVIDPITGLKAYSLYGKTRKPLPEWLEGLDLLVYDIQDIGNRTYTFIYTMANAMEAAAEKKIPFVVLDRPNPLGGELVDGNILDYPAFSSFIGKYPLAYLYGMTPGETATFFNKEFNINCDLHVVTMEGWKRTMKWWHTGLPWVPTSMGIPGPESAFYIAITGALGEMQTVCEGVGTTLPFQLIGAPWMDAFKVADALNAKHLSGVQFRPAFFTPHYYKFEEQECAGVEIYITNFDAVRPLEVALHIIEVLVKLYPDQQILGGTEVTPRMKMFDYAWGTDKVRRALQAGKPAQEIIAEWKAPVEKFLKKREQYLLYY
jgi:uncharacterized protein YbbC (DUF1343 family)